MSQLNPAALDASALIEAGAVAESRRVSGTTSFGIAVHPDRRIDIAAFLPPVLEYRVNAPLAFAEFAESGNIDLAGTALLALSRKPEVAADDTMTTTQQQRDRTFWYMVFAAYNSPAEPYAATNALVQTSLATVDRAGVHCTYITFSGTNVADTAQLTNVLQTWASTAPPEMAATTSVLSDGAQQLSSCDPGAGFESGARFGVAREIARLRTVELAASEHSPWSRSERLRSGCQCLTSSLTCPTSIPLVWHVRSCQARTVRPRLPRPNPLAARSGSNQSRKLLNCSGMPMSSAFSIAITSCR